MPRVSVIMTAWNSAATIGRAIESVLGQECPDIELIVVDDQSTDSTADVVRDTVRRLTGSTPAAKDVMLRRTPKNVGCGGARAYGLQFATGDYVAFCDSDDWLDGGFLKGMVDAAERNNADVVHCPLLFLQNGEETECSRADGEQVIEGDETRARINDHWMTSFNCMLIRREHIAKIKYSDLRCLDDRLSGMRLLMLGGRHVMLPKGCGIRYNYAVRDGSVFNSRSANIPVYDAYVWMQMIKEYASGKEGVVPCMVSRLALGIIAPFLNGLERNRKAWTELMEREMPDLLELVAKFAASLSVNLTKQKTEKHGDEEKSA